MNEPDPGLDAFPSPAPGQYWPATSWSLLEQARAPEPADARPAMERLMLLYYKPIRRFFERVLSLEAEDCDDVTQEFFARFLERDVLDHLHYQRSFRGFLKVACRRHYLNWLKFERVRRPRDGARQLGMHDADGAPVDIPVDAASCDSVIDDELCRWYLSEASSRLEELLRAQGKELYFAIFTARVRFDGEAPTDYKTLAERFGVRLYDVRNYLSAARKVFRRILWQLAGEHSSDPREELRELGLLRWLE